MPAVPAKNGAFVEFLRMPNGCFVAGDLRVALETWVPATAAFKFDGDDIELAAVMSAPRLRVNVDAIDLLVKNSPHRKPQSSYRPTVSFITGRNFTFEQTEN